MSQTCLHTCIWHLLTNESVSYISYFTINFLINVEEVVGHRMWVAGMKNTYDVPQRQIVIAALLLLKGVTVLKSWKVDYMYSLKPNGILCFLPGNSLSLKFISCTLCEHSKHGKYPNSSTERIHLSDFQTTQLIVCTVLECFSSATDPNPGLDCSGKGKNLVIFIIWNPCPNSSKKSWSSTKKSSIPGLLISSPCLPPLVLGKKKGKITDERKASRASKLLSP